MQMQYGTLSRRELLKNQQACAVIDKAGKPKRVRRKAAELASSGGDDSAAGAGSDDARERAAAGTRDGDKPKATAKPLVKEEPVSLVTGAKPPAALVNPEATKPEADSSCTPEAVPAALDKPSRAPAPAAGPAGGAALLSTDAAAVTAPSSGAAVVALVPKVDAVSPGAAPGAIPCVFSVLVYNLH